MKISANKFVSASYNLYVGGEDGAKEELMETATAEKPLVFLYGTGMMLEAFESNLKDLEVGADFDFVLTSDQAYGEFSEENVVDLPRSIFEVDGAIDTSVIFENNTVPMVDRDGNKYNGTVVSIGKETIKMDFNHPLAGENLHFIGKVIDVHEATEEELGSFMNTGGGCSCGSDGCGSGSCGEDGCGSSDCGCSDEGASSGSCGCGCGH